MIILPIADRQLRVAARSARTYSSRRIVASVALGIFLFLYVSFALTGGGTGLDIFRVLSRLTFIYALLAGLILTADCISSERREGTLGLLFLTSLKPFDIVSGNIVATSLQAFYGLLATLPILGISVWLGGVSYGEFGRVCLTLISSLGFSVTLSLLISCLNQRHLKAISQAALLLACFVVLIPQVCSILRHLAGANPADHDWIYVLSLSSPLTTLELSAAVWAPLAGDFWRSLLVINLVSASALGLCQVILPRVWKDRSSSGLRPSWGMSMPECFRVWVVAWNRRRQTALEYNPFYWLATRRSSECAKFLGAAVLLAVGATLAGRSGWAAFAPGGKFPEFDAIAFAWAWVILPMHAVLLFKCAALASQRFAEDRKSGALELLLATPLNVRQILRGQWRALIRQMAGPALATLAVHGLMFWVFLMSLGLNDRIPGEPWDIFKELIRAARTSGEMHWEAFERFTACSVILGMGALLFLDWIALACVGMWMGLRTKRPALAVWITLGVVLLPQLNTAT